MLEILTIGEIVNVHGVKGALKVQPLTDNPLRFKKLKNIKITVRGKKSDYEITNVQFSGNTVILALAGIDTRDKAELMRGGVIEIPRSEAIELPEDHYFIGDLIGCDVYETDGNLLGKLNDVLQTGSNDVYSVKDSQDRTILIPAIEGVVKDVDISAGKVTVELLPGLKEIYYEN